MANKVFIFMDIGHTNKIIGRLLIEVFPDIYPDAVNNFITLCKGDTERTEIHGVQPFCYKKTFKRSYVGAQFNKKIYDNYILTNDANDDVKFPAYYPMDFFPHDRPGLISLVPTIDPVTKLKNFDSNFMITLNKANPDNLLNNADVENLVIGNVYQQTGNVLEVINQSIVPFIGKKYPEYYIADCGIHHKNGRRVI